MRRLVLVSALLAASAACDTGPSTGDSSYDDADWKGYGPGLVEGRARSTSWIEVEFQGMHLEDGVDVGIAGMAGMTCEYFTSVGSTGTDVDVTDGTETVDDARPADALDDPWGDDVVVLGHSELGEVHEVGMPSGTTVRSVARTGTIATLYVPEGIAVLRSEIETGCMVEVLDGVRTPISGHFCAEGVSALPTATGLVLVDGDGAVDVTAGVATELPFAGTAAALDATDHIVLASGNTLLSVDREGNVGWMVDLGEPVVGLTRLGGEILASVGDSWRSRLVIVDTAGSVTSDQELDRAAGRVYASADGKKAALASRGWGDTFAID